MKIEIREEELTKLKNQNINLRAQVRNFKQSQKTAASKAAFSDTEKLIILEGVLLQVVGTEAQEPITRIILAKFSDDAFWDKHKHDNIEKILIALAKSMN